MSLDINVSFGTSACLMMAELLLAMDSGSHNQSKLLRGVGSGGWSGEITISLSGSFLALVA